MNKASICAHSLMILLTITAANSFCSERRDLTGKNSPYNKEIPVKTAQEYEGAVKKLINEEIYNLEIDNPKQPLFIKSVSLLSPHTILSSFGLFKLLSPYTGENAKGLVLAVGGAVCSIFAINTLWNKYIASEERNEDYLECWGQINGLKNFQETKLSKIKIEE